MNSRLLIYHFGVNLVVPVIQILDLLGIKVVILNSASGVVMIISEELLGLLLNH